MKVLRYGHLRSAPVVVDVGLRTEWNHPTPRILVGLHALRRLLDGLPPFRDESDRHFPVVTAWLDKNHGPELCERCRSFPGPAGSFADRGFSVALAGCPCPGRQHNSPSRIELLLRTCVHPLLFLPREMWNFHESSRCRCSPFSSIRVTFGGGRRAIVSDTLGDIAGMKAVVFGSFAEVTCAALVLCASSDALENSWKLRGITCSCSLWNCNGNLESRSQYCDPG